MPTIAPTVSLPIPIQGVRPDLDPTEVPPGALVAAQNWIRREGRFRVRPGFGAFAASVGQRPMGYIVYPHHDGATRLVLGTMLGWWRFNAATGAWVDITDPLAPLTGSPTNHQVFRVFSKAGQTMLLGVNGVNPPKKWDGLAAAYANLGGTPPVASTMMALFDRVILGNLSSGATISPVAIDVSANKDFDAGWGNVLTAVLAETPGAIVAMQEMGFLQGAIYKEDAVYLVIAQGGAVPFRLQMVQRDVPGPVSPAAVAALTDGAHAFLAADGSIQLFDGAGLRSLGLAAQRHIAATMDFVSRGRAWVAWDSTHQHLWCVYVPVGGIEPAVGAVVEIPSGNVYPIEWASLRPSAGRALTIPSGLTIGQLVGTIGQQTATIGEYDRTLRRVVIGDVTGQSYQDNALDDAGVAIPTMFETGLSALGDRRTWKTVGEVEHFFRTTAAAQPVSVFLGASDYGEARTLTGPATFDLATGGPYRTGHRLSARLLSLRIECDATQEVVYGGSEAGVHVRGPR